MSATGQPREPRLGIDIGRVIISGPDDPASEDTDFFDGDEQAALATPEVPGALDTIARLVDRFGGRVWLVSKCGPEIEKRTLRWLAAHDFHAHTGIPPEHVRFCRARADKRGHARELGLTHFVDDRPEVHAALRGVVDHQFFFGPQREPVPGYGQHAPTWPDTERLIQRSLGAPDR